MTDYLQRPLRYELPEVASATDEMSYWSSRFASLIFANLELRPGLRALDLGTGTGCPLFELAQLHGPSGRFVGVDVWRAGLARAAQKRDVYRLPQAQLVAASGEQLPFASRCIELIVGNLLLNNLPHRDDVLRECRRVMTDDARLVLTTNLVGHMSRFYEVYRSVLAELGLTQYLPRLAQNEAHRGTRAQHLGALAAAGLSVARAIDDELALRFLDGSALLRHALVRIGFLDGWRQVVEPQHEQRVFGTLEVRLNELAEREGELRLAVPMLYIEARKA